MKTQTREVLAGAYRGGPGRYKIRQLHTHLVWLDDRGNAVKVGCRQPLDNLADEMSLREEDRDKRPTCPTCAKKWDKEHGR